MAGAVNKMMASATAPKTKPTQTAVTISVDAADRKGLSRSQVAALNRAQTLLAGSFEVSVEYGARSEVNRSGFHAGCLV